MISPLLDPNVVPLVRAPERRPADASAGTFEHAVAATVPDGSAARAPIELELQDDRGAIRTIALPWGLAASSRLSQQASETTAQTALFLRLQPVAAQTTPAVAGHGAGNVAPAAALTLAAASSAGATASIPLLTLRDAASPSANPVSGPGSALRSDTGMPWQERWLQWLRGSGRDLQLRLRDYRLDEADHPKLLEQLHLFARDQGLALTRVSVNGHELWRAPDPATGNHHGR